jgi:DNA-binding NarL/FixJ family response regulator
MSASPASLRVLIADDDADQRLLLRRLFARAGVDDVEEAADGAAALAAVGQRQPTLIVLDLAMPILTGIEVLPALRDAAPAARIVVLSSFPRRRLLEAVRQRGAMGYVQKDVSPDRLVGSILLAAALTTAALERRASDRFPNDAATPSMARRFVREVLGDAVGDLLSTAELLVSELVTNAVLHASSEPQVDVVVTGRSVRIEVFDDDPALPQRRTPDALRPGGRGLLLLEELSSRWGAEHHGTGKLVWFELDRPAA